MLQHLKANTRAAWARAYVRIIAVNREPSWIAFEVILPVIGTASYVYIYKALNAGPEFMGFAILGGAMTSYWMNVLWAMASQFYWEKQNGNLELFFVAPMSRMAILIGMAAGGAFTATTRSVSVLLLGSLAFGVRFSFPSPHLVILTFVLTVTALYGMGMLLSSVFLLYGREAWHTANLLQEPVYLLTGLYFPIRALGFWVAMAGSAIPLSFGIDAMRQLIFSRSDIGFLPVSIEISALAVQSMLFLGLAYYGLHFMEVLAKREGRLTLKWQ